MRITQPSSLWLVISFAAVCAIVAAIVLAGDGSKSGRDDLRELVAAARAGNASLKEIAAGTKAANETLRQMSGRVVALEAALASARRAAIALNLEVDTACGNDPDCAQTAKAVCGRIGYPNGVTSRFTAGPRPLLHALVCFD